MNSFNSRLLLLISFLLIAGLIFQGCSGSAGGKYFGKTVAPKDNVFRYVSGSEPESLDPHISSGQPEARIYMALYEGLVEYGPKDQQPIPSVAKRWEGSPNVDEFIFYLRENARWSDGTPITARDFVYSFRRGFAPETLSRTAELGYFIKYAEAFNGGMVFVKKDGEFLLASDFGLPADEPRSSIGPPTDFQKFLHSPTRLMLPGDEEERSEQLAANPKLKAAVENAEMVPISEEDIGVEAIDDFTLRLTLRQPAPFFLGLLAHQFFRLVPGHVIREKGSLWHRKENIVTCGPFKIRDYRPYDALVLEKDPMYWDADNVHLSGIEFYPIDEPATIMNLYKGGAIDAFFNHVVPPSWIDEVSQYKDEYMNLPENATAYYSMNMTKPPFDDLKVRRAFQLSIDRIALTNFRKVTKPLFDLTPDGIFPDYDKARKTVSEEKRVESGASVEVWERRNRFDPEEGRKLLGEAGYPVTGSSGNYSCPTFPTDAVSLTFNTSTNNRAIAEFIQAQWKQNLGITVPLKSQEFKTFLKDRNDLQYLGLAQSLWSGDYMDPYTFLGLHYGRQNNGAAGFYDPKYDEMLNEANRELDTQKRYEKLARAEFYLMERMPVVTLSIYATNWMKKPFVKGLYPNPGTLFPWKFVYIEPDESKWDRNVENLMTEEDPQVANQLRILRSTQVETGE